MTQVLRLRCPQCKKEAPYGGYPSDPVLSSVVCLGCGYAGAGGTFEHRHPRGELCSKEGRAMALEEEAKP